MSMKASTLISVQAIIMSVHTQVQQNYMITSIVNVIKLMLFTVVSIVNKQGR